MSRRTTTLNKMALSSTEDIVVLHRNGHVGSQSFGEPTATKPSVVWMPMPEAVTNCPSGLEYLTSTDLVVVHQQVELIEAVTGFETNNKYTIRNSMGETMYSACEDSTSVMRHCLGKSRPFELSVSTGQEVETIRYVRPFRCHNLLGFCCLQELEVQCPPGETIGWVKQNCSFLAPRFSVLDDTGQVVYRINGPCFSCKWCDVEFQVVNAEDSEHVGTITKQWSGLSKEYFSDADNFGIRLPKDMDVRMKAILLGAVFLIDFMYFEH